MDVIGEIDRRGADGKVDHVTARRDGKDPVGKEVDLHRAHELLGVVRGARKVFLPVPELLHPRDLMRELLAGHVGRAALLLLV